jgi:amino acid transporter
MTHPAPPPESAATSTNSNTTTHGHFHRSLGLFEAIAVNMTQMCGIGPFITIPLLVAAMGGPQAIIGWILGAVLAMADGLVWAELGAAMPGAGGTYLYLREAFQYRTGRLMPFLFIWTAIIAIPLCMSTGVIGLVDYLQYVWPEMSQRDVYLWSVLVVAVTILILYRNISAIGKITAFLWVIMIATVAGVIVAAFSHFDSHLAFTYPKGAFTLHGPFWAGLGAGLIIAVYDYLGYNTTAYMGQEMRDPGLVIPGSIIYSILGIMALYLAMNVGVLGVLPWQQIAKSQYVGAEVIEHTWGRRVALVFTVLIIITAFASVLTGLLGGSRVPYNAARDKVFFPIFGRLHPTLDFPHVALLVMGAITAIASFFNLNTIINMLVAVTILVQSIAQVAALTVLRRRQPGLRRPYRMILYPLPSVIALIGWCYLYVASDWIVIALSLAWLDLGVIAFLIWAYKEKQWPYGPYEPKEIREEFLNSTNDG